MGSVKRILIVDDYEPMRRLAAEWLKEETDLMVCGEAENCSQALESIASQRPDLAIVDISLDGENGIDLIKAIRPRHPRLPVIVHSSYDDRRHRNAAYEAGAQGYVVKRDAAVSLLTEVRRVLGQ